MVITMNTDIKLFFGRRVDGVLPDFHLDNVLCSTCRSDYYVPFISGLIYGILTENTEDFKVTLWSTDYTQFYTGSHTKIELTRLNSHHNSLERTLDNYLNRAKNKSDNAGNELLILADVRTRDVTPQVINKLEQVISLSSESGFYVMLIPKEWHVMFNQLLDSFTTRVTLPCSAEMQKVLLPDVLLEIEDSICVDSDFGSTDILQIPMFRTWAVNYV